MMCPWNIFRGYIFYQLAFYLIGSVSTFWYQSEAMAHAEDMGVNSHSRLAESYALNDVSRLTTNSRQVEQLVHVGRHFAMMPLYQLTSHHHQMLCLRVGIRNATDILQYVFNLCLSHSLRIGIVAEKLWRYLIDTLVRTLGAEDDSHQ